MRLCLIAVALLLAIAPCDARDVERFCDNWRFTKEDPSNAEMVNFDDSDWQSIRLPHDWPTTR